MPINNCACRDSNPKPSVPKTDDEQSQPIENKEVSKQAQSNYVARLADWLQKWPELGHIIDRWQTLPEHTRKQIIELAGLSGQESNPST